MDIALLHRLTDIFRGVAAVVIESVADHHQRFTRMRTLFEFGDARATQKQSRPGTEPGDIGREQRNGRHVDVRQP